MNRSANGLLIVTTTLDGFSLANRKKFTKFSTPLLLHSSHFRETVLEQHNNKSFVQCNIAVVYTQDSYDLI